MASENRDWATRRIAGAFGHLGYVNFRSNVGMFLRRYCLPRRRKRERTTPWSVFHSNSPGAVAGPDFFTAEVLNAARVGDPTPTCVFIHLRVRRVYRWNHRSPGRAVDEQSPATRPWRDAARCGTVVYLRA